MLSYRLTRNLRLLDSKEFQAVFDENRLRVARPALLLLASDNKLPHPRLGLVMRKKCVKLAVNRNKIKRQVRESFRLKQHQLVGFDCVIMTRPDAAKKSPREIRQIIDEMFDSLTAKAQKHSA